MAWTDQLFVFNEADQRALPDGFFIDLPMGINDKAALFSAYAEIGRFPGYFGGNWDALNDCLRDFFWVTQKRIIIVHSDLPFAAKAKELSIYLSILGDAVRFWRSEIGHELIIAFPADSAPIISRLGAC